MAKENDGKVKNTDKSKARENELMKYEIAEEIGLIDKVNKSGWKSLTARESGRIGGLMTKRKREMARKDRVEEKT